MYRAPSIPDDRDGGLLDEQNPIQCNAPSVGGQYGLRLGLEFFQRTDLEPWQDLKRDSAQYRVPELVAAVIGGGYVQT